MGSSPWSGPDKYFYISLSHGLVKFRFTSRTKFLTRPTNILWIQQKLLVQAKLRWSQQRTPDFRVRCVLSRHGVIVIDYMISSNRNFQIQCNLNQRLLSWLHNMIIYHVTSYQRYGLVCNAKDNNITDLPDCCYVYTHNDLSVYCFHELERKMCWDTASDVAAIINRINRHFRLTRINLTRLSPS